MRWYDEYDEIRTGGAVGLSYPMQEIDIFGYKLAGRVGLRYTLEQVQMDDVEKGWGYDADGDELEFGDDDRWDAEKGYFRWQEDKYGDNLNSIFRLYWSEDKRNHPFFPTRGYQATIFGDASEGGVGDNEFYKVGANYKHWFELPWYKHVFSVRGRIETVDAYNGDLPVYERLFLGGPRSIRGVEYRDIGIILEIIPQVTSNNLISFEISQEISEAVTNTYSTIDSPMFSKRKIESTMTIANGRSMILGGLIQEKRKEDLNSLPIIAEIPFINSLLGKTDNSVERTEVLMMITGFIIDERSPVEDMLNRYNESVRELNSFENELDEEYRKDVAKLEEFRRGRAENEPIVIRLDEDENLK